MMTIKAFISSLIKRFIGNILIRRSIDENQILFSINEFHFDNCLALMEYLISEGNVDLKCILLVEKKQYEYFLMKYKDFSTVKVLCVRKSIFRALEAIATSKFIFYMNHDDPMRGVQRRPGQVVINLWHGSGYKAAPAAKERHSEPFDAVLVPGPAFIKAKADYFHCQEGQVLPIGYPRYDNLLHVVFDRRAEAMKHWAGEKTWKKLLWMPTYRQTDSQFSFGEEKIERSYDLPLISDEEELLKLDSLCARNDISLLIKRHPHQKKYHSDGHMFKSIRFVDNEQLQMTGVTLAELMSASDGLISDYSSAAVDYMLLDKPIAFLLEDFKQYADGRGFVFDNPIEYMPGHHIYTYNELLYFLQDIKNDLDPYKEARHGMMNKMHNPCNNYCERIWIKAQSL